ncbi:MAG: hypothetical protein LW823_09470 [Rickettsiales bacterium]|nr:hypothetical protein [Rickettsiales bacterium]
MAKILLIKNGVIPRDYSPMVVALERAGHTVEERAVSLSDQAQDIADELKNIRDGNNPESSGYDLVIMGDVGRRPDGTTIAADVTRYSLQLEAVTEKPVMVVDDLSAEVKQGLPDNIKRFSMSTEPRAIAMAVNEVLTKKRPRDSDALVR